MSGHRKKGYISGPMTGYPDMNRDMFEKAEANLVRQMPEYEWINPHEAVLAENCGGLAPRDKVFFLRKDIRIITGCQAIALLPKWEKSLGACCEVLVAAMLGLEIFECHVNAKQPVRAHDFDEVVELANKKVFVHICAVNYGGHCA